MEYKECSVRWRIGGSYNTGARPDPVRPVKDEAGSTAYPSYCAQYSLDHH